MTRSGAPASSLPVCKLFYELQFLRDKVTNRPTTSNLAHKPQLEITERPSAFPPSPTVPLRTPSPAPSLESTASQPSKRKRKVANVTEKTIYITDQEHPDNFLYQAINVDKRNEVDADQKALLTALSQF